MTTHYVDFANGNDGPFFDVAAGNHQLTIMGAAASSATAKFGTASLNTGSNLNSGVSTPASADWQFGSGQFTIECFARYTTASLNNAPLVSQFEQSGPGSAFSFGFLLGSYTFWGASNSSNVTPLINVSWLPTINTWYHLAVDRDASNVIRMYVDGAVVGSTTNSLNFYVSSLPLIIGNDNGTRAHPGLIDELRITKGVARYAGAFTAPTAAFADTVGGDASFASVGLLTHFELPTGLNFANRKRTIAAVTTAAAGDVVRVMATPDETLVGNATWTNNSKTVTLASAVTVLLSDCETAWTAATNITATADTSAFKENTKSAKLVSNGTFTTGLVAYRALGSAVDLSAYQQISFWFNPTQAIADGLSLSLRLCSDAAGVTSVHTVPLPTMPSTGQWTPVTFDFGAALSSSIQSIALYADKAFTSKTINIDNVMACKASSAADSLTLNSLIGKVWNRVWVASTAYSLNDIRKPTQPNRNGWRYKVTTAGTTGSTEPTWPADLGLTVTDGSVVWTCEGQEDTYYAIKSINGTTVILDTQGSTAANGTAYQGATETVATYKREPFILPSGNLNFAAFLGSTTGLLSAGSGTAAAQITYSGGWDRTAMTAQTGETWQSGVNNFGTMVDGNGKHYITLTNLNAVRFGTGIAQGNGIGHQILNCHVNLCGTGLNAAGGAGLYIRGAIANHCQSYGLWLPNLSASGVCLTGNSCGGAFPQAGVVVGLGIQRLNYVVAKGNTNAGVTTTQGQPSDLIISNLTTGNNGVYGVALSGNSACNYTLINAVMPEASPIGTLSSGANSHAYSHKHQGVANSHLITTDGGTIITATDQLYTAATGVSWKFRPTSTGRTRVYPLRLSVAKIRCAANVAVSVTIPTRRDNANIVGRLLLQGGQLAGIGQDVFMDCQPTINTWAVSTPLTFTPTEDGVVEIVFLVWDGVGTTNNFWISTRDLSVT
jgi:hypothetical protein